jgi:acetyltransferase-like isoleucine patch superfamily enzyme
VIGLHRAFVRVRNRAFTELVRRDFASFGPRSTVELPVRVWGEGRIDIGAQVVIGAGSWLQALDPRGRIVIGDGTSLARACTISSVEHVELGESVLVAGGVYIADHHHRRAPAGDAVKDQGVTDVAPVHVGHGAWIGQNAVVLPGASIGEGSVVGANAVVRGQFPPRTLIAGVPARAIRSL